MIEDFAKVEEFPLVEERNLYAYSPLDLNGSSGFNVAPNHKAIVDSETGRVISVVG